MIADVYAVETFGLDPVTQRHISDMHAFCVHTDAHPEQPQALMQSMTRALRRAQSDERAAFVVPSGPLSDMAWPLLIDAARTLAIDVRVAHGLGVIESLMNVMQLPMPRTIDARPQLSDFVHAVRNSAVMVAPTLGDRAVLRHFDEQQIHCFAVNLYTKQVSMIDIDDAVEPDSRHIVVATHDALQVRSDAEDAFDINDTLGSTGDWIEILTGLTEVQR